MGRPLLDSSKRPKSNQPFNAKAKQSIMSHQVARKDITQAERLGSMSHDRQLVD
jgi:hypothetical protein